MPSTMIFDPEGGCRFIHSDLAAGIAREALSGRLTITRASHVEPTPEGLWEADLSPVGGPVLGPFAERSAALKAEVRWLEDHDVPVPSEV